MYKQKENKYNIKYEEKNKNIQNYIAGKAPN